MEGKLPSPLLLIPPLLPRRGLTSQVPSLAPAAGAMEGRPSWGMKTSIHNNIKSLAPERDTGLLPVQDTACEGKGDTGGERLVNAGSVLLTWQAAHRARLCL